MRRFAFSCLILLVAVFLCVSFAFAGEVDVLVNKLVEKGVLTQGEAQQMLTEAKEESRKEIAQGKNEILPKWLQTTKFGGDLRVRYQGENKTGAKHRDRGRFRLRYGFEMKPNDLMKVGFRMATGENKASSTNAAGGPEQTSTNQSFTGMFQNKPIWVDQAYVEYRPFGNKDLTLLKDMKLVGGKFANPFYTTDMVWDPDINPEGGYVQFTPSYGAAWNTFFTFGFMPIGETSGDSNDPFLFAAQGGVAGTIKARPYKFGISYFNYDNVKGYAWNSFSNNYTPTINNTLDGVGTQLKYDFNIVEVAAEFSPIDLPALWDNPLPLTILGDYADNTAKGPRDHVAWLAGLKMGKAKEKGTWELFWNYRQIGQDAVLATINDSDFHLGGTGAKGNKFGLTYAVMPNSTLSCTYFITDPYKVVATGASKHIDIWQVDWVTKF